MKIPAGALNSAWRDFSAGAGKSISHASNGFSAIRMQSGIKAQASMALTQAKKATLGNMSGGFRAIRGGNTFGGAGRMAAGAGMAWMGMGAINMFRPGDNLGMF